MSKESRRRRKEEQRRNRVKSCRNCKGQFTRDNSEASKEGCCSTACLIAVGPMVVVDSYGLVAAVDALKRSKPGKTTVMARAPNADPKPQDRKPGSRRAKVGRQTGDSFYKTREWRELRYDVLAHYGAVCMLCNRDKGQMHVDHIQPRSKRRDLSLTFSNLQVLCEDCNIGKSNRDNKDFRPTPTPVSKIVILPKPKEEPINLEPNKTQLTPLTAYEKLIYGDH